MWRLDFVLSHSTVFCLRQRAMFMGPVQLRPHTGSCSANFSGTSCIPIDADTCFTNAFMVYSQMSL